MAQTVDSIPRSEFQVEVSTDGSTWTDISGQAATVTRSDGDQPIGEQHTADGVAPIVSGSNKKGAETISVSIVYTEDEAEAFDIVNSVYRNGNPDEDNKRKIYLRYAPRGGIGSVAGNKMFTCCNDAGAAVAVPIINCNMPDLDAGSGDPAMCDFSVRTPALLEATTATS